jgi:hypothetical protein
MSDDIPKRHRSSNRSTARDANRSTLIVATTLKRRQTVTPPSQRPPDSYLKKIPTEVSYAGARCPLI